MLTYNKNLKYKEKIKNLEHRHEKDGDTSIEPEQETYSCKNEESNRETEKDKDIEKDSAQNKKKWI